MVKIINLHGHCDYSATKKLILDHEDNGVGTYSIESKWKDSGESAPLRVIGDIEAIDFDGGPYLSLGSKVEDYYVFGFITGQNGLKVLLKCQ